MVIAPRVPTLDFPICLGLCSGPLKFKPQLLPPRSTAGFDICVTYFGTHSLIWCVVQWFVLRHKP
jgi:hypothetical protein